MWTHLERQAGGLVKGMGEKQIEVDKRILRTQIAGLKRELESVRGHRQQYRDRRASVPIPVISLVGHTNAGKSTLLNRLSGAGVLAEDRLFATLDPTTRRVEVAAFRATLEEISDSSLLVHVMDAWCLTLSRSVNLQTGLPLLVHVMDARCLTLSCSVSLQTGLPR